MPEKINYKILANFSTYKKVLDSGKYSGQKNLDLVPDSNHAGRECVHSSLTCGVSGASGLELRVDAHAQFVENYAFKLILKSISDKPIFRFDAHGAAHRNKGSGIALIDQMVSAPHFQMYDEEGWNYAYKSRGLDDAAVLDMVKSDINAGMQLFSDESNTFAMDGGPVWISRGVSSESIGDKLNQIKY